MSNVIFKKATRYSTVLSLSVIFLSVNASANDLNSSFGSNQPSLLIENRSEILEINGWNSWCVGCQSSPHWIEELNDQYAGGGLRIIAVANDKVTVLQPVTSIEVIDSSDTQP